MSIIVKIPSISIITFISNLFFLNQAISTSLNNLESQTEKDWELIVITQGDIDCKPFQQAINGKEMKHIVAEDGLLPVEKIIEISNGEYITYWNTRVAYYPGHLSLLSSHLSNKPDVDIVFSEIKTNPSITLFAEKDLQCLHPRMTTFSFMHRKNCLLKYSGSFLISSNRLSSLWVDIVQEYPYFLTGAITGERINMQPVTREQPLKILILIHYMNVPPFTGGLIRMLRPLISLSGGRDYEFTILFPADSEEKIREIKSYFSQLDGAWHIEGAVKNIFPVLHQERYSFTIPEAVCDITFSSFSDKLTELLQQEHYDIIQLEHSQMGWVIPLIRNYAPRVKIVLNLHNVEWLLPKRTFENGHSLTPLVRKKACMEWVRMNNWEQKIYSEVDHCITISPVEKEIFSRYSPGTPVTYIPIGLDLTRYDKAINTSDDEIPKLLFMGHLEYYPNLLGLMWFTNEVWPSVLRESPRAELHVVGYGVSSSIKQYLSDFPGIKFWGQQEDETYFLKTCHVFIVPLFIGAGSRIKIVTSWASGLPAVSTTIGAEGLLYRDGENILIADDPASFADKVLLLINNPGLRKSLSDSGLQLAREHYSLDGACRRLDSLYKSLMR